MRTLIICMSLLMLAAGIQAADRPNILFMMVDDMGKEWVGCYGGEGIETPHLDKLAAGGMLFHNAYSMPQCIPTRMCIMTGQCPSTSGWVDHWDPHFFNGKGRTENRGTKYSNGEFGPDQCFDFATDFMRRNKENSFFVYYAFNLVHGPFVHTPLEKAPKHKYAAMVRYMDHLMGKMVAFLEAEGLRKKTVIVWTTDNGSPGSMTNRLNGRAVKGGKTKTTENGIDAPFIVNCPGIVPAGGRTQALLDFTDLVPTFADFAGAKLPEKYKFDGDRKTGYSASQHL